MWEWLVICISIAVVAVAFVVLVIYFACALHSLKKLTNHLDRRVHDLDPYFHVLGNVGRKVEKCAEKETERFECKSGPALNALEWALMGLALWQKFKERR